MSGRRRKMAKLAIAGGAGAHTSVEDYARAIGVTEKWLRQNGGRRVLSILTERASRLHREQQAAARKERDADAKHQRERAAKRRGAR